MPRRQRRSKRRQPASDGWVIWACDGLIPDDTPENAEARDAWITWEYFENDDDKARQWREHGERALAVWIHDHPGTRPSRWWRHAAPEPRRQLAGSGVDSPFYPRWPQCEGIPHLIDIDEGDPPVFETERDYLARLGLLLPMECADVSGISFKV